MKTQFLAMITVVALTGATSACQDKSGTTAPSDGTPETAAVDDHADDHEHHHGTDDGHANEHDHHHGDDGHADEHEHHQAEGAGDHHHHEDDE